MDEAVTTGLKIKTFNRVYKTRMQEIRGPEVMEPTHFLSCISIHVYLALARAFSQFVLYHLPLSIFAF